MTRFFKILKFARPRKGIICYFLVPNRQLPRVQDRPSGPLPPSFILVFFYALKFPKQKNDWSILSGFTSPWKRAFIVFIHICSYLCTIRVSPRLWRSSWRSPPYQSRGAAGPAPVLAWFEAGPWDEIRFAIFYFFHFNFFEVYFFGFFLKFCSTLQPLICLFTCFFPPFV